MQYFVILTLSLGADQLTSTTNLTVGSAMTRAEIYDHMLGRLVADNGDQWLEAATVFFSAESNALS